MLRLEKNLYGLKQAGLSWFETLRTHLLEQGFIQSESDPCFFHCGQLILVCYVDDCLIFAPKKNSIDHLISNLQENFVLTDEGDVDIYLGIKIERLVGNENDNKLKLSQPHLTKQIIDMTNLTDQRMHDTPAEPRKILMRDSEGEARRYKWSYHLIVGMLNYLCIMRPEILFAVHQCARFGIDPRLSHEIAIKRIVRYLKRTELDGLILTPDLTAGIKCYVDADFAGAWDKEDSADPSSVYSRTGYVIMYASCPILWVSKLQTEIALSTTEAEYIALSQAMRDLIPFMPLVENVSKILGIEYTVPEVQYKSIRTPDDVNGISVDVYEDNRGALELANVPKLRPRTKHIALKYHHFREHVRNGKVRIHPIDTREQIADIFTKALPRDSFQYLRHKLCGW